MKAGNISVYFFRGETITKLSKGWEVSGSFNIYQTLNDAKNYVDKITGGYFYQKRHERINDIKIIGTIDYSNYDKTGNAQYNYSK
jgi:hypothetical protein